MTRNTDDHAPDDRPAGPPRRRSRPTGSPRPTGLRLSQTLASPRFVAVDDVLATGGYDDPRRCGPGDVFVARMDGQGRFVWVATFGGAEDDIGHGIAVSGDGIVYIVGSFQGQAKFGTLAKEATGATGLFLASVDSAGRLRWVRTAEGGNDSVGRAVVAGEDGSVWVTGDFQGELKLGSHTREAATYRDLFVAQLDSTGKAIWVATSGSKGDLRGAAIARTGDGSVVVGGAFYGSAQFGSDALTSGDPKRRCPGSTDQVCPDSQAFVATLDGAGAFRWARSVGGPDFDHANGLVTDPAGRILIVGSFGGVARFGSTALTSRGGSDMFVSALDQSGTFLWTASAGGSGGDTALAAAVDGKGNVVITGSFEKRAGFGSFTASSSGKKALFVAGVDPSGRFSWARYTPKGLAEGRGIALAPGGQAFVVGFFVGEVQLGGSYRQTLGGADALIWNLPTPGE